MNETDFAAAGITALREAVHDEKRSHKVQEIPFEKSAANVRRPRFVDLHSVPQLPLEDARPAFPALDPNFPLAWKQQVRQLRTRLDSLQTEHKLHIISITSIHSDGPRHGLAANLAYMLASMQETRVLLIDAKVNNPDLERKLKLAAAPGLCEATRAKREALPACLRRISGTHLYMMPTGQTDSSGMDPIDLRGLQALLDGLKKQFDWIVIDSPGFDTPADAMSLNTQADGCLLLVQRERDTFNDVSQVLNQMATNNLLGTVLL